LHDSNKKLPETKSDINTERTHNPTDSNNDISDDEIISLVLQECKKGDYKMIIVPIDIWDFGGQKIYYMTHQLFISSMGSEIISSSEMSVLESVGICVLSVLISLFLSGNLLLKSCVW
jgi:hypothetical protein